jgi:hypothetical protein
MLPRWRRSRRSPRSRLPSTRPGLAGVHCPDGGLCAIVLTGVRPSPLAPTCALILTDYVSPRRSALACLGRRNPEGLWVPHGTLMAHRRKEVQRPSCMDEVVVKDEAHVHLGAERGEP